MNKLLTLTLILASFVCFAQTPKPEAKTITIPLSKGEQLREQNWRAYSKQVLPVVEAYLKQDSSHQEFIKNTITPYLILGDTVQEFKMTDKEISLILKPKKK